MPLRHEMHQLILAGFREHGIDMPFPPFQMRLESIDGRQSSKTMTSAGKPAAVRLVACKPSPARRHRRAGC